MTTIREIPSTIVKRLVAERDFDTVAVQNAGYGGDAVYSGVFIATLHYAGIIKNFQKLQILLQYIVSSESDIHDYGSGALFEEVLNEFYGTGFKLFNNTDLFGTTEPQMEENIASKVSIAISQVSNAMELIRQALDLIDTMYGRVNNVLKDMNSDYLSTIARTEHLVTWAYRKGLKLNPEIYGIEKIGVDAHTEINRTDLHGLLDMFDRLTLELETLREIPVYYRTGNGGGTDKVSMPVKVIIVNKNESINAIAARELGSADKAIMILDFNGLTYNDIQGDDWHGMELKIPYISPVDAEQFDNNFVLDSHAGIEALGKDLPNELISDNGDLTTLDYTDTFGQSLNNIILTPYGSIPEQPNYGNRVFQLNNEMIPMVASEAMSVEIARALKSNPRVSEVVSVKVKRDNENAAIRIKFQVRAINQLTEVQLLTHLDEL